MRSKRSTERVSTLECLREVPRSIGATRRFRGLVRSDAALAERSISCGSSLPLLQTIDRSRRLSDFSSLSSTSGVSHRPKYPIHPRRYSAKSWTIRTRLKAVGAAPLLSSGKARRYWFFCRLSAVELRCVLIAPFIPFRGPFGPSLPSQLLRPLPPGQKRFLAPQSRIRDR
jgi:hypothetical protein